ncbi:DUF6103 family protein [Clostridium algoriphilum]|uniref:DUF6103 family protein n=1 Tax=Clostridium algoriphilum TaxID=198347 RepID=UPI001CF561B7|nr:DUF6103 family protein [Clostridium algoriphilum]MCB2295896.1 DUF6103 family protein [Clostridium algoriphilum]
MKKIQLKVEFNEEKMKAIKVSLKDKNKDFDTEIIKFLNGLYNKNVPKSLKSYIEIDLEPEEKVTEDIKEEKKEEPKEGNRPLENRYKKY